MIIGWVFKDAFIHPVDANRYIFEYPFLKFPTLALV